MQKKTKLALDDILEPIESYLKTVEKEIPNKLKTGIPLMDSSSLHLFKKGGKKIRASIVILTSGLNGEIPDDITEIATAIETVHGATLIHDDIIDQTFLRRGDTSVPKQWGNKVAVLIGDFMFIKALQVIVSDKKSLLVPEVMTAASNMIKGELYQIEYSHIDVINKEHYFKIIELKTALFMGICAKLGAMKADMSDKDSDLLYQFGLNLGRAFQIIDDTLDYVEKESVIGKDSGNDFANGKITLPFLHLLDVMTQEEKELLIQYAKKPDKNGWKEVKRKVEKYKAIGYSMDVAKEYVDKALSCLEIFPSSLCKDKLIDLSNYFIERDY